LRLLGEYGVAVVASAGNDATARPSYPAAFAPHGHHRVSRRVVPVSAVGALNPDGSIALFSNDGPWVKYLRPGASLVSTLPTTFDGSQEPSNEVENRRRETRASLDPDDFSSGFAVWSGTSFAAPVFAGQLAQRLLREFGKGDDEPDPKKAVARARKILRAMPQRDTES
jgi:subtilisin family serine protease